MRIALLAWLLVAATSPALAEPARILSIGGSITETIYLLGEQDRLVAVDTTSLHPPAARALPNVGYMRTLSAEPILALAPDLVLADADAGPEAVIDQLRQAGIALLQVPKAVDIDGVAAKIRKVASALGRADDGAALAERIHADAGRISQLARGQDHKPRVLFMLSIGRGAPLASGHGTAAAGMIEAAGGVNAIDAYEGYKPLSPEAAVIADPDIVLVTDRTLTLLGGQAAILDRPEIAPTRAGRDRRLVTVDGLLVMGFGPRIAEALSTLTAAFHPGLPLPGVE